MEKEKYLTYDQIMALFNKFALDREKEEAKRREEEAKRREEEAKRREEEAKRREEEAKRREEEEQRRKRREEEEEQRRKRREEEEEQRRKRREEEERIAKKRNDEADKRLKKLELLVGNIGKNNGYYAEEFFQKALAKTLTFAGIKFDKLIPNLKLEKKETCEFDIVLVNGDCVAIIEAKNRVHPNFVEELATKKLAQFRKYFPEYANYRIYLGIAGLSFDESVVEEANKYGVGMVRQDGKSIEINADSIKVY